MIETETFTVGNMQKEYSMSSGDLGGAKPQPNRCEEFGCAVVNKEGAMGNKRSSWYNICNFKHSIELNLKKNDIVI